MDTPMTEQQKLIREANQLLRKAGFRPNGQPTKPVKTWNSTGESLRTISTPMGGMSGYRRR